MGWLLEFESVSFRYSDGGPAALHDVSFRIAAGERVAVLGPNGAGKSTLLLHANGLLLPRDGRVVVDGIHVTEETGREVRKRVGLVFQDPDDQLFLPTLLEDVAFAPLNEGLRPADAAATARASLAELGLADSAGRAAHHLSGGEKRLASLATVLVSRPRLLALDEPTGQLDAKARARVVHLLRERTETLLIATHDLEVAASLCTRAIVLDRGSVHADTALADIIEDEAFLRSHGLRFPL